MTYYIQRSARHDTTCFGQVETVDEFETLAEAASTVWEYRMSDTTATYMVVTTPTEGWTL